MADESLLDALARAIAGDRAALAGLLVQLAPIVQARASRALARRRGSSGRDARQELRDMVQEVFVALVDDDARVLRAWSRDRGLSLENFVGLVAERQVASILRTGRRSPWTDEPTEAADLEAHVGSGEGGASETVADTVASRELVAMMVDRLREELTPRMLHVFYALWVHETRVATICTETGMTPEAVYMARTRIAKRARAVAEELLDSPLPTRTPQVKR